MTSRNAPIRVLLAANPQELTNLFGAISSYQTLQVVGLETSHERLLEAAERTSPEVAVVDAPIMVGIDTPAIKELLERLGVPVILLYPIEFRWIKDALKDVKNVVEYFRKPVDLSKLVEKTFEVGTSERILRRDKASSPLDLVERDQEGFTVTSFGVKIIAMTSAKVGVGNSTVVSNLAAALAERKLNTLVVSFETPDDLAVYFDLNREPNIAEYFASLTREGFEASIQRPSGFETLDVVLSPNDREFADGIVSDRPDVVGSLIMEALDRTPPYDAILMDLPSLYGWNVWALFSANTLIIVSEPSVVATVRTINRIRQALATFNEEQGGVPREGIYMVLNKCTDDDNLTPEDIRDAITEELGFAPPIIATIPFEKKIRTEQNVGRLPYMNKKLKGFRSGVDKIVETLFKGVARSRGRRFLR